MKTPRLVRGVFFRLEKGIFSGAKMKRLSCNLPPCD